MYTFFLILMMPWLPWLGQNLSLLGVGGGGVSLPIVFDVRGSPNTEAFIGTNPSGQVACAAYAYCSFDPDSTLAGNAEIVFYTYLDTSTQEIPTVTDDKGNTYTACSTEAHNATDNGYLGCAYKLNAITGTRKITVTWPSVPNAIDNVSVATVQCANCTAFDVFATNAANATGTFTSGSATSTAPNDLWFEAVQMDNTTNVGTFTAGSQAGITWVADLADQRDGFFLQHGIQAAAGALNPSSSNSTTSKNYTALGIAFKTGPQGTAPSGMYIRRIYSVSTAANIAAANQSYQLAASAGDLLVVQNSSSGQEPTGISDNVNGSWLACGNVNQYTPNSTSATVNNASQTFYFPNSAGGLLNLTITVTGTASLSSEMFQLYFDFAGADTVQPQCNRMAIMENTAAAASSYTMGAYAPSSSKGYSMAMLSVFDNTGVGFSSPTGALQDANSYGGMLLNGPEQVDNNDPQGRLVFSANTQNTWTINWSSATTNIQDAAGEIVSFHAAGATLYPAQVKSASNAVNATGTTTAITGYTPYKAGDLLWAAACSTAGTTGGGITISDGTNTYTSIDNNSNTASNTYFCRDWYVSSVSGSNLTITATFASSGFRTLFVEEVANATTVDAHGISAVTSASTGILTGTGLATNFANEIVLGVAICTNNCVPSTVLSGGTSKPFTNDTFDVCGGSPCGNVAGYRAVSATGTYSAIFVENTASSADSVVTATFH